MANLHRVLSLVVLFTTVFQLSVNSQSFLNPVQEKPVQEDSVKEVIKPYSLNNLNNASTESFALFSRTGQTTLRAAEKKEFVTQSDSLVRQTASFIADTVGKDLKALNFRELEILENSLRVLQTDINKTQVSINERLEALQESEIKLAQNRTRWALTRQENIQDGTPLAIKRRVDNVLSRNDSISNLIRQDIDFLLTQSDKVTGQQIRLDEFEMEINSNGRFNSSNVFKRDALPIWQMFSKDQRISISDQWSTFLSNFKDDSDVLFGEFSNGLIVLIIIFIVLFIVVFYLKASVKDTEIKAKKVILGLYVNEIFQKPIEVALLIGLYLTMLIIPEIPATYASILALVSVYAIIRLAIDILPQGYRKFLIGFSVAFILLRFYNMFYDETLLSRLILLTAQLFAFYYLVTFINSRRLLYSRKKTTFNYILSALSTVYLVLLTVSIIGNIAGTIGLTEFLSTGIIRSGFLVITTYVGFHISTGLVYLLLSSSFLRVSNIIREQASFLFEKLYSILRLFFVLSWIYIALDHFTIQDVFFGWWANVFTSEFSIGKASFALINIVLFIFVIWLSIWISKIVRHVLMEEVFTRVNIQRGMPGTIIMLVRISVVSIGFFLAAAAAGMELSNLTIIIGAFSVGIGFGLQNIFNNLVSGLILVFERPIKEGDIVEVNTLLGHVKKIGIRSSIVRTFSGAEVIVPNGELISNDLTNWTLSDQFRRSDIKIGVAYGTDPEKVINILLDIANSNKRVNPTPKPQAFFVDFGDSSLDFRLLAWIDQDYRFPVESEIRVEINRKLKEAGIVIPFPQRDLHVMSVTDEAGKRLKGN